MLKTRIFKHHKTKGNAVLFSIFVFSNIFTNANRNKTVPVLNNTFFEPRKTRVNAARLLSVVLCKIWSKISQTTKMPSYPICQNLGERLHFYEIGKTKIRNNPKSKSKNTKSNYEHRVPSINPSFIYITICCSCFSNLFLYIIIAPGCPYEAAG